MNSKITPLEGGFVCTRGTRGKGRLCCPLYLHSLKNFDLVNSTLSAVSTLWLRIWKISNSWRVKTFKEPVNFQWNPSPLSESQCWKTWDWSRTGFPPQTPVCCGQGRASWSNMILGSPLTAARSRSNAAKMPQPPVGNCFRRSSRRRQGMEGPPDSCSDTGADPQEIKNRTT